MTTCPTSLHEAYRFHCLHKVWTSENDCPLSFFTFLKFKIHFHRSDSRFKPLILISWRLSVAVKILWVQSGDHFPLSFLLWNILTNQLHICPASLGRWFSTTSNDLSDLQVIRWCALALENPVIYNVSCSVSWLCLRRRPYLFRHSIKIMQFVYWPISHPPWPFCAWVG